MSTIGFIGAGHIGSQVARLAVANGHDVVLSNSRGPASLAPLIAELGSKARAGTPLEAATAGEIVVVTIPLKNYRDVPVEAVAGKIVIDTNNSTTSPLRRPSSCRRTFRNQKWSRRSTTSTRPNSPPMVSLRVRRTDAHS